MEAPLAGAENNIKIHVLEGGFIGHVGGFYLKGLKKLVKDIAPDIIHAEEEPYSLVSLQACYYAKKTQKPFVIFTWENILRAYRLPMRLIDKWVLKNTAQVIAGNQEGIEVLKKRGFEKSITIIPQYGIDPNKFRSLNKVKNEKDKQVFIVGYFGRLLEEKGIDVLIKAIAKCPEYIQLHLVGSGSYEKTVKKMISSYHLENRVSIKPAVDNDNMPAMINTIDALVLPSRTTDAWKEQFGRILIEAMACEVPVIGSDSGEIPHVIKDAGLIFAEGQVRPLVDYILMLSQNKNSARQLGQAGRKRVLENYITEKIAELTLAVYNGFKSGSLL